MGAAHTDGNFFDTVVERDDWTQALCQANTYSEDTN
jgi:hypothetical protein